MWGRRSRLVPMRRRLGLRNIWEYGSVNKNHMKAAVLLIEVKQDARHTLRLWARRPWHTGFAILALAIGIGTNTGVFSVVNALLLRSLPFHDAERLASLQLFFAPHDSAKQFHEWRGQS